MSLFTNKIEYVNSILQMSSFTTQVYTCNVVNHPNLYWKVGIEVKCTTNNNTIKHKLRVFEDIKNPLNETELQKVQAEIVQFTKNIIIKPNDRVVLRGKTIMLLHEKKAFMVTLDGTLVITIC